MENSSATNSSATNSTSEKKNKTPKKLFILVILLLFCFCGYLIWQNLELQKSLKAGDLANIEMTSERDQVKGELEEMLSKYKEMESSNEGLSTELEEERAKIEELLKKAKGKDWSIYKLRKETASLRTIMKGFVVQIDSLNQINGRLTKENKVVKNRLTSEKDRTKNLTKQNEGLTDLVTVASHLKTTALKSYGVRVKSNNTGKESDRAKKIGKIRTTFTVLKNDITKPGKKWIYTRILTPDGKVLSEKTDDSNKFDFNGVRGFYSSKKQIDYKNQQQAIQIDWNKTEDFPIGEYNVEIYSDGVDIGKTKFYLK
jgi:soluble cytochrome b562